MEEKKTSKSMSGTYRRSLLGTIGTASAMGLAGCLGGGGDDGGGDDGGDENLDDIGDDNELGESVEEIVISYWSNLGAQTAVMETALPVVQENYEELGLDVTLRPVEYIANLGALFDDQRVSHMNCMFYTADPVRLDPQAMLENFRIDRAGGTGTFNMGNWADCEMTRLISEQQGAESAEEREETVLQAQKRLTESFILQPLAPTSFMSASWDDLVDVQSAGVAGVTLQNTEFLVNSSPNSDEPLVVNVSPTVVSSKNYATGSGAEETPWNNLVNSPLQYYDQDNQLQNMLADEINIDGTTVTVTIREDANFQNGDPVTAEDVDWTFNHLWDNPADFSTDPPPYDSTEVADDKTWVLNLSERFRPLSINFAKWGIFHKESWVEQGAEDDPAGMQPDNIIGSGPYELADFEREQFMRLNAVDTHPVFQPEHDLIFQVYRDSATAAEAFRNKELDILLSTTFAIGGNLEESSNNVSLYVNEGTLPIQIINNVPKGAMKFREFRHALGKSIDRQLINELAYNGQLEMALSGNIFMPKHPSYPGQDQLTLYTEDLTGDVQGARQVLADAGWGWDDNDNLHYSAGADLEPPWPKGETPDPANYDCLNEDGEIELS